MRRLFFCALVLLACASLDSFLYNGQHVDAYSFPYDDGTPEAWKVPPAQREEATLTADDGSTTYAVTAWQLDRAHAPTILYHHGNKWGIDAYWTRVGHLWSLGANVIIYDYPGYGRCDGTPTEAGIYSHARAAWAYLQAQDIDRSRIYHYGYSLGGGPAIEMAKDVGPFHGLILESTFASVAALVEDGSLVVPRSFVTSNRFDNVTKVRVAATNADVGALLFHGTADDFVNPKYVDQLGAAIGDAAPHEVVKVDGADHDGVPSKPIYDQKLSAMLAK